MRKKIVAANWKMNGQRAQINQLLDTLLPSLANEKKAEVVIFPPAVYLAAIQQRLQETGLSWGAQNVYPAEQGAFTGELSGLMLNDFACRYVLVGHSERRQLFAEDEKFVAEKFHHVKEHAMIPILCVGETLEEREAAKTKDVIARQILAVTKGKDSDFKNAVIAYEPVWAIGTGKTATVEQVQVVHAFIRELVADLDVKAALDLPILYGGSVNEHNAKALFDLADVDGGLVGGASLKAQQFVEIVKCIN